MRLHPLIPVAAAATAAALVVAAAGPAAAAASPATGNAVSSISLLQIAAAGNQVTVGTLALRSSTLDPARIASIVVTPLMANGTAYGRQTVTPANSPVTVPAVTTSVLPAAVGSVLSVGSPAVKASATDGASGPSSSVATDTLGALSVLGLAVNLQGVVKNATEVTSGRSASVKHIAISKLALPSIGAVLASLGLDVRALPTATLTSLLANLGLLNTAVSSANTAVTAAQAQLTTATAAQSAATAALATSTATLTTLLGATSIPTYAALSPAGRAALELVTPGVAAAYADYIAKGDAVGLAQVAVATAQTTLTGLVGALVAAVQGVLNNTPLLSLDSLTATTSAIASSASAGGQSATITGGQLTGLKVMGTDVLATALGTSTVDLSALAGSTLSDVTRVISGLTSSLAGTLSGVTGLTLTAPQVGLLTKSTSTGVVGGFGVANTALHALTVTLPTIKLPQSLAVLDARSLPAFAGTSAVNGVLSSAPGSIGVLTLSEQSSFRPAVVALPTTPGSTPATTPTTPAAKPQLASTGPAAGVASLALLMIVGAAVLRRRMTGPTAE